MANLHLVTGYAGTEHITATDQAAFNAALIGTGQFVLDKGKVFEALVVSNNQIRIHDGELMMQGRFVRLNPDTYVDLAIENGVQGKKRNDFIAARYTKDNVTGVEEVNLVVIKGTSVDSNPSDPAHTEADITNGEAVQHDFPLWRIPLDGLNVGTPVALFGEPFMDSMRTLPEIREMANSTLGIAEKIYDEVDTMFDGFVEKNSLTAEEVNEICTQDGEATGFLGEKGLAELWSLIKAEDEAIERTDLLFEVAVNTTNKSTNSTTVASLVSSDELAAIFDAGYDEIIVHYKGTISVTCTLSDTAGYGSITHYQTTAVATHVDFFSATAHPSAPITEEYDECGFYTKGAAGKWYLPITSSVTAASTTNCAIGLHTSYAQATYTGTLRIYGRRAAR